MLLHDSGRLLHIITKRTKRTKCKHNGMADPLPYLAASAV